jgi:competence protein ComEA
LVKVPAGVSEFAIRHRRPITIALVALALAGGGAWTQRALDRRALVVDSTAVSSAAAQGTIRVQVVGAVAKPGVYSLAAGDRVEHAVGAAGGATSDADLEALNLVARAKDEMRIVVPTVRVPPQTAREQGKSAGGTTVSGLIDLNTATSAELETLPGIGPVTATHILDYRARNGAFRSVDDLLTAKLVSTSTMERIRPLVVTR